MKLTKLLTNIEILNIVGDIKNLDINKLYDNSKKVKKGGLFVAIAGRQVNAHIFCRQAIKNGAVALVVEEKQEVNVPQIIVKNSRLALSLLAKEFYKSVLSKLKIVSVIGTNGKTTTAYFIKQLLELNNKKVGFIGTNNIFINSKKYHNPLTTPDTLDLFYWFEEMLKAKVEVVVMEISAHAIFLNKVEGFKSDVAVFTNLASDHLDFFKSTRLYENTKLSYFNSKYCKNAVINKDDLFFNKIAKQIDVPYLSYSALNKAEVSLNDIKLNLFKSSFKIVYKNKKIKSSVEFPAFYNLQNLLGAISALVCLGFSFEKVVSVFNKLKLPDGRFKKLVIDKNCSVVIDYSHTEKAFERFFSHIKKYFKGKIICVFGAPGSRDHLKREKIGKLVSKYADYSIITSDNPDTENPYIIFEQIKKGFKNKGNFKIIEDRFEAITFAFKKAKKSEKTIICVLGKGNEGEQIINGISSPYNDEESVKFLKKENENG